MAADPWSGYYIEWLWPRLLLPSEAAAAPCPLPPPEPAGAPRRNISAAVARLRTLHATLPFDRWRVREHENAREEDVARVTEALAANGRLSASFALDRALIAPATSLTFGLTVVNLMGGESDEVHARVRRAHVRRLLEQRRCERDLAVHAAKHDAVDYAHHDDHQAE